MLQLFIELHLLVRQVKTLITLKHLRRNESISDSTQCLACDVLSADPSVCAQFTANNYLCLPEHSSRRKTGTQNDDSGLYTKHWTMYYTKGFSLSYLAQKSTFATTYY